MKNEILTLLCSRLGQLKDISEIDYGRIEELSYLITVVLYNKKINHDQPKSNDPLNPKGFDGHTK